MRKKKAMIAVREDDHRKLQALFSHPYNRSYEIIGGYQWMINVQNVTRKLRKGDALFIDDPNTLGANEEARIDAMVKIVLDHGIQLFLVGDGWETEFEADTVSNLRTYRQHYVTQ